MIIDSEEMRYLVEDIREEIRSQGYASLTESHTNTDVLIFIVTDDRLEGTDDIESGMRVPTIEIRNTGEGFESILHDWYKVGGQYGGDIEENQMFVEHYDGVDVPVIVERAIDLFERGKHVVSSDLELSEGYHDSELVVESNLGTDMTFLNLSEWQDVETRKGVAPSKNDVLYVEGDRSMNKVNGDPEHVPEEVEQFLEDEGYNLVDRAELSWATWEGRPEWSDKTVDLNV